MGATEFIPVLRIQELVLFNSARSREFRQLEALRIRFIARKRKFNVHFRSLSIF